MSFDTLSRAFSRGALTMSRSVLSRVLIVITSLTVCAWVWLAPTTKANPPAFVNNAEAANAPQGNSARERVGAEVIKLRADGFEPSEITRSKGRFILHVENRTALADISFSLSRETNGGQRGERLLKKRKWVEMVDLPPGQYVLTETSHPNWSCRITITP